MDDKPLMDIIRMWCVEFDVKYIKERKYWYGVIFHRDINHLTCMWTQETDNHAEHHDVLVQAVAMLKSRVSASCCIIEVAKEARVRDDN